MMRTWIRKLLLVSISNLLLLCKSYGALSGSDDFNDNSADNSKWGQDRVILGGALAETNGRLEYSANGNAVQETRRPWILNTGDLTSNWEVQLDVAVSATLLGVDQYASFGIDISNSGDLADFVYIELYNSTFTLPPSGKGFYSEIWNNDSSAGSADSSDLGSASGAVRVTYDSTSRVLRSYYDANGPTGGYSWTELGSFGVGPSGGGAANADWGMAPNSSFIIDVYGYSDSVAVPAGSVYGDNFVAVPEPSSAVALTTLLLLVFAGTRIRLRPSNALSRKAPA
jgi:hypothetical protein